MVFSPPARHNEITHIRSIVCVVRSLPFLWKCAVCVGWEAHTGYRRGSRPATFVKITVLSWPLELVPSDLDSLVGSCLKYLV